MYKSIKVIKMPCAWISVPLKLLTSYFHHFIPHHFSMRKYIIWCLAHAQCRRYHVRYPVRYKTATTSSSRSVQVASNSDCIRTFSIIFSHREMVWYEVVKIWSWSHYWTVLKFYRFTAKGIFITFLFFKLYEIFSETVGCLITSIIQFSERISIGQKF